MGWRKQTSKFIGARSCRPTLVRRVAGLFTATSLLPILLLGPFGPGLIVIHDHHEEDLHAHKIHSGSGGQSAPAYGHDHPAGTTIELEGAQIVLTIPELPQTSTKVQVSVPQLKLSLSTKVIASILLQDTAPSAVDLGSRKHPVGALRAHDTIAELLLSSHSLLI